MQRVVMSSGGIDSTVVLAKVVNEHGPDDVTAIWVNYGQRTAEQEKKAIAEICRWYDVELVKVAIVPPMGGGVMLDSKPEIPKGSYEEVDVVKTGLYVPARNAFLICIGANYAFPHGVVYTGVHGVDSPYADVKKEFVEAIDKAIQIGTYGGVRVEAPLVDMTKVDIIRLGAELKVPFELTYSCYRGWESHCGECPTCQQRKEAFRQAGVEDPTEYER